MVATYFAAFPDEAEDYKRQLEEYEAEEEQREQEFEELCYNVIDTVHSMSEEDLKQVLLQLLFEGPEWQFERFVNECFTADTRQGVAIGYISKPTEKSA